MRDRQSQLKLIAKDLKKGKKITPLQALKDYGAYRLSGRIFELKQQGMRIKTTMVYEHPVRFAMYSLK